MLWLISSEDTLYTPSYDYLKTHTVLSAHQLANHLYTLASEDSPLGCFFAPLAWLFGFKGRLEAAALRAFTTFKTSLSPKRDSPNRLRKTPPPLHQTTPRNNKKCLSSHAKVTFSRSQTIE